MVINGDISSNLAEIKDRIVHIFSKLYTENENRHPDLDGLPFKSISVEEAERMEQSFDKRKVIKVVRDMNGEKAPGRNGSSMAFFQTCWDIIEVHVMKVFSKLLQCGKFECYLHCSCSLESGGG